METKHDNASARSYPAQDELNDGYDHGGVTTQQLVDKQSARVKRVMLELQRKSVQISVQKYLETQAFLP
jgi:hypothetical protein